MRQVEITEEQDSQRPWVAVDRETRRVLLRMDRLEMLLRIADGLGWEIKTQAELQQAGG